MDSGTLVNQSIYICIHSLKMQFDFKSYIIKMGTGQNFTIKSLHEGTKLHEGKKLHEDNFATKLILLESKKTKNIYLQKQKIKK